MTGTNFDVQIDTDASRQNKEFFITDIRGLSAAEVRAGFDVGLTQYNEGQLANFANENSYNLSSFDESTDERRVVLQAASAPFGRFNGGTSRLTPPELQITASNEFIMPLVISCQIYVTENDVQSMLSTGRRYHIYSTNQDAGDNFDLHIRANSVNDFTIGVGNTLGSGATSTGGATFARTARLNNIANRLLNIVTTLRDPNSGSNAVPLDFTVAVNNQILIYQQVPKTVISNLNRFLFVFGALNVSNVFSEYFSGLMRNIVVTADTTNLVTIVNPSTGTNSGTAANAVVTNITSVTTIRK